MATISEKVLIDILEKKVDGTFKQKHPTTRDDAVIMQNGQKLSKVVGLEEPVIPLTLKSGAVGTLFCKKDAVGNVHLYTGYNELLTLNKDQGTVVATLPTGYEPSDSMGIVFPVMNYVNNKLGGLRIGGALNPRDIVIASGVFPSRCSFSITYKSKGADL